jgi:hypothetical protein
MSIMDEVRSGIEKLTPEQIRERLVKAEAARKERMEKQKVRLQTLTPEQKAQRTAKANEYRTKNAEKFKAAREAYNKKPEVVAKRKAYMQKRNLENKLLRQKAKELGITV